MFDRLLRLFARAGDRDSVAALDDRELADLGLTRDQALNLARLPAWVPDRVAAMGRLFGLAEADLIRDRGLWEDLLLTCRDCRQLAACRRLLDRDDRPEPTEAAFCPNAARFALPSAV